jgi:hypothetical protein
VLAANTVRLRVLAPASGAMGTGHAIPSRVVHLGCLLQKV